MGPPARAAARFAGPRAGTHRRHSRLERGEARPRSGRIPPRPPPSQPAATPTRLPADTVWPLSTNQKGSAPPAEPIRSRVGDGQGAVAMATARRGRRAGGAASCQPRPLEGTCPSRILGFKVKCFLTAQKLLIKCSKMIHNCWPDVPVAGCWLR